MDEIVNGCHIILLDRVCSRLQSCFEQPGQQLPVMQLPPAVGPVTGDAFRIIPVIIIGWLDVDELVFLHDEPCPIIILRTDAVPKFMILAYSLQYLALE